MNEVAALINRLTITNGVNGTCQDGVFVLKATEYQPRQPLCYEQGIIFVGQGSKRVFLGDKEYEYNPDNYLVLTVPLPARWMNRLTIRFWISLKKIMAFF